MRRARKFPETDRRKARCSRTRSRVFICIGKSWANIRKPASWPPRVAKNICTNIIKKHELTRPDKEDDRVRHIETLNSQTGPVFLTYRAVAAFDAFVAKKTFRNAGRGFHRQGRRAPHVVDDFRRARHRIHRERNSPRFRFFTSPTGIIAARRRRGFSNRAKAPAKADNFSP